MGIEVFSKDGGSVFAEHAIFGAKGSKEVGVDIKFTRDFAMTENWNDDFGFGFEGAGEIARIVVDVVHDDGFSRAGRSAADALI